jgi:ABC-type dipeptide/oligopeptide/nickel transport system permease subunit
MSDPMVTATPAVVAPQRTAGLWSDAARRLVRKPLAVAATLVILTIASMAVVPRLWTSTDPHDCDIHLARQGVSGAHPFGVSELGCDYYAMAVHGSRPSLTIALVSMAGMLLFGLSLGVVAGYYGGWRDALISRAGDLFLGLPFLLGSIVLLILLKTHSIWPMIGVFVLFSWPLMMRITRANALAARNLDYVQAARALGATTSRVLWRHVLPNCVASALVVATISLGSFVSAEATLSYLGVGLRPPAISWGLMINSAQQYFLEDPHLLLFPATLLVLTVLSFILLCDALRDALDPKAE